MKKGIFCLEGLWEQNLRRKSSVHPILELLERNGVCSNIYKDSATHEEFEYYLDRWKLKSIGEKYPILYFAFHGSKGCINITDSCDYTLEMLGDFLEGTCERKIIFFASCETLNIDARRIHSFLNKTKALAVIGYKSEVDWMLATAFELLVLNALQDAPFDSKGIEEIGTVIKTEYGKLHSILDFRMFVNKEHFPRKRNPPAKSKLKLISA
ncbi:DUF6642 family protein [Adhaeribacter terreus]|uniref:DUF6642 family protein n=1 Tax=Adhaeribacter terreus TaxID=529703 RepID=A0ABW0EGZ7_9BACT